MLMLTKTHLAIVAEKDAQILHLEECHELIRQMDLENLRRNRELKERNLDLWERATNAEARLAPFIAERKRDGKGHFLSNKGSEA